MRFIMVSIVLVICSVSPSAAATFVQDTGGFVIEIQSLEVQGAYYNVAFHKNISFNDLYGATDTGFATQPYFWGNSAGAYHAADAIMKALLGNPDTGMKTGQAWAYGAFQDADYFLIPFQTDGNRPATLNAWGDGYWPLHSDGLYDFTQANSINKEYDIGPNFVFATFQTLNPVPVPGSGLVLLTGLVFLAGLRTRQGL